MKSKVLYRCMWHAFTYVKFCKDNLSGIIVLFNYLFASRNILNLNEKQISIYDRQGQILTKWNIS